MNMAKNLYHNEWQCPTRILSSFPKLFKHCMMLSALAAFLILPLSIVGSVYNQAAVASYTSSDRVIFSSYDAWELITPGHFMRETIGKQCLGGDLSSYIQLIEPADSSYILPRYENLLSYNDNVRRKKRARRWIEKRDGGNGQSIACYVRVSSLHQANEGFSVDAQIEKLKRMIEKHNPSIVYWFVDPGMTGTRFDNRAVVDILKLRKQGKIAELCVCEIDRIGRDAPKLMMFFFEFCEDGGRIRTPEAVYDNSQDLAAFIILTIKAFAAQDSNQSRSRASVAGKAESFRQKRWNKRIPSGYTKVGIWIQKIADWEQVIKEIFALFLKLQDAALVADEINKKYEAKLHRKLKRIHIFGILTDPVYVGRPEHLDVTIQDASVAFVDEDTFQKCQAIIDKVNVKKEAKPLDVLQEMLAIKHVWALRFIEKHMVLVHKDCGGAVDKNGSIKYNGFWQQLFRCRKCKDQWRVPSMSQLDAENKGLIDDARDLLREVIENKKKDRLKARGAKENESNRSQSLEDLFWQPLQPITTTSKGPDFGILYGWLFQ